MRKFKLFLSLEIKDFNNMCEIHSSDKLKAKDEKNPPESLRPINGLH